MTSTKAAIGVEVVFFDPDLDLTGELAAAACDTIVAGLRPRQQAPTG